METAHWSDIYTAEELATALRFAAARIAKRQGAYDLAQELTHAAECIEDLATRVGAAAAKAEEIQETVKTMQCNARAALESLSKLPQ